MSFIFMDESGDLGFNFKKKKTSKFFVVTFVFIRDKDHLDRIIKKIFKWFSRQEIRSHNGVLHAHKEKLNTRIKLLKLFHDYGDAFIVAICLNKNNVDTVLRSEKHILYNYVTNILLDRVLVKKLIPVDKKIKIYASRRETSKFLNINFSHYLKNQAKNKHKLDIEIEIVAPSVERGLQVTDMISWSIFRKHEHGDDTYYKIIKPEIVEENSLF